MEKTFSAVITKDGKFFASYCPELGVASQGKTKKSALANLKEAAELYLEEGPIGIPENPRKTDFFGKKNKNNNSNA